MDVRDVPPCQQGAPQDERREQPTRLLPVRLEHMHRLRGSRGDPGGAGEGRLAEFF